MQKVIKSGSSSTRHYGYAAASCPSARSYAVYSILGREQSARRSIRTIRSDSQDGAPPVGSLSRLRRGPLPPGKAPFGAQRSWTTTTSTPGGALNQLRFLK